MSIKNKKQLTKSNNDYRWERIEDYLISQGYVLTDPHRSLRVWVDCVSNGRTIQYNLQSVKWQLLEAQRNETLRIACLRKGESIPEGEFNILCTHSNQECRIYKSVRTVRDAVKYSRDSPRW